MSSTRGLNWQRWKKKKKAGSPKVPPTEECEMNQESPSISSSSTSSASGSFGQPGNTGKSCNSPTTSSTSRSETSTSGYNSPSEKQARDYSASKRRRKSKFKETARQCGSQHFGQNVSIRKQHTKGPAKTNESFASTSMMSNEKDDVKTETTSETVHDSGPSASAHSDSSKTCKKPPDIPGFYYDDEKKRYFKILPGHNIPHAVTQETIRLKEAEKKRQSFFTESENAPSSSKRKPCLKTKRQPAQYSIVKLHLDKSIGHTRSSQFQRLARENGVKHIGMKPRCQVTPFPDRYFDGESGYISHLELDSKQRHVLMVVSDDYLSRVWQGEVVCARNPETGREETTIANWTTVNILTTRNCKVTHTSWAQVKDGENMYALYAISGGTSSSVQLFKCPSEEDGVSHISYRYESNHEMAWTCAWSNSPTLPAHLAVGSTRKAIVVDTLSARKQKLHTCHSDVFSQVFSRKSPILYNGTRRGEVLGIDLRIPSHSHVDMTAVLRHNVSVCSLKLLQDENYLLASDMGGGVKLWDVRKSAVVQEFKGHHNENYHLPVKVDSTESIVHAVGQDKYTRLWSLKSGQLLQTIPCPSSCQEDNIPSAVCSQEFSSLAQPGVFIGQERQVHWYPMR